MSLRQQQVAVFSATVVVIFGILGIGIWWIAQRLTTEATLQTALLMARQVEIALADSLRERSIVVQPQQGQKSQTSFGAFWAISCQAALEGDRLPALVAILRRVRPKLKG